MAKTKQTFSIRATAETLVPDQFGRTNYLIALSMILVMVAIIVGFYVRIPAIVPLYFSLPWGEARLAEKLWLLILPGISLGTLVMNVLLARVVRQLSPLLPRVLAVATIVISLMMSLALAGILQSLVL